MPAEVQHLVFGLQEATGPSSSAAAIQSKPSPPRCEPTPPLATYPRCPYNSLQTGEVLRGRLLREVADVILLLHTEDYYHLGERAYEATGVTEVVLRRFADAEADVDLPRQRVRIPPALAARCLDEAGKHFTIHGRDVSRAAHFGQGQRNYNSIAGEASWIDEVGAPRRYARLPFVVWRLRLRVNPS